jgi:predicted Zn-ribbon and HTH transcriptional regulator
MSKKIVDTYVDNYDITYIHNIIINNLKQEIYKIPYLEKELNNLQSQADKPQTYNVKKEMLLDIAKKKEYIKNNVKINNYMAESTPIIKKYLALVDQKKLDNKNNNLVDKIIDSFLVVANKYIDISVTKLVDYKENNCNNCDYNLTDVTVNQDHMLKCPNCHTEHQSIINKKFTYDTKINYTNSENDIDNFMKALMRYEGLQEKPPLIIYEKLDTYFKERGLMTSKEIKSLPYNSNGKKGNTNREMLCNALSAIGYSDYYEDSNLIGHIYWDWKLPNLIHLKPTIIRHYTITQKCFYKIPLAVRDRISSLGTQYRLRRHLQLVGHDCDINDFKIAENATSLHNHDRIWKLMCEMANDPEIYYID